MVLEIFARRNNKRYRILILVESTEFSTVGKKKMVIEIVEWRGDYSPSKMIYQIPPKKLHLLD
tara:strand:+ start:639 stop:827 length:189 start_codon:yes stop_codon:yes gene_type:complete